MIFLIVVYSLAMFGFLVLTALITIAVIGLWHDVHFTISNKPERKG